MQDTEKFVHTVTKHPLSDNLIKGIHPKYFHYKNTEYRLEAYKVRSHFVTDAASVNIYGYFRVSLHYLSS